MYNSIWLEYKMNFDIRIESNLISSEISGKILNLFLVKNWI